MTDKLTIYESRGLIRRSGWRWSYQAAGNNKRMGNGGEAYVSLDEAVQAALRVCGLDPRHESVLGDYEGTYARIGAPDVQLVIEQ
jgi:hypothetical protein